MKIPARFLTAVRRHVVWIFAVYAAVLTTAVAVASATEARAGVDFTQQVVTGQPPAGTVGIPYDFTFVVAQRPFFFEAFGLPDGLGMTVDGRLFGTPTTPGDYPIEITVGTLGRSPDLQQWVLHIAEPPVVEHPPAAIVDKPYSFTFAYAAASPGATFEFESGELPDGLKLYPEGRIAGKPGRLDAGSAVTVRASTGALLTFTIPVHAAPGGN